MKQWFALLCAAALLWVVLQPQAAYPAAGTIDAPCVALTFDDGPRADTTGRLLDGLAARGAKATFFVIGQQIPGNEELLLRMAAEGHQVGSHTYSHVRLQGAAESTVIEEIAKTEVLLTELLGEGDYWLRPPYGLVDDQTYCLAETPMIYWSLDPEDWKVLDTAKVVNQILKEVEDGDIILLHDFYPTSVEAALQVIDVLQGKGYQFLTVAELFDRFGTDPQPGVLYADAVHPRGW